MKSQQHHSRLKIVAAGTLATLAIAAAGCTHSDNDPNAAPYGAAASPSSAPTAPADAPTGPPPTAETATAPTAAPSAAINSHKDAPVPVAPAPGASPASAPVMGAPMMGMSGGSPTDPLTPTPDLDAKIAGAGKDGKKPAIGAAYAERGTFRMNDGKAGARVKYRAALDDYRKALAADPTNAEAKKNKDMIEDIYKQMGRPIPE